MYEETNRPRDQKAIVKESQHIGWKNEDCSSRQTASFTPPTDEVSLSDTQATIDRWTERQHVLAVNEKTEVELILKCTRDIQSMCADITSMDVNKFADLVKSRWNETVYELSKLDASAQSNN